MVFWRIVPRTSLWKTSFLGCIRKIYNCAQLSRFCTKFEKRQKKFMTDKKHVSVIFENYMEQISCSIGT